MFFRIYLRPIQFIYLTIKEDEKGIYLDSFLNVFVI